MLKKGLAITLSILSVLSLRAQTGWLETENPSSLGIVDVKEHGETSVGASYLNGDYRRAQESGTITRVGGESWSYRSIEEKLRIYGRFGYGQEWHTDRCWSDNYDPFNGNPYIVGGDIAGNYAAQTADIAVKVSSMRIARKIYLGLATDYSVGDFSRSNDPRSRAQDARYSLKPGIIWCLSENSNLGLTGIWEHSKEKMLKLVGKSESIDHFNYYDFQGIAEYKKAGILTFTRRYIANWYGGQLQYSLSKTHFNGIAYAGFKYRNEAVTGEAEESPGCYSSSTIPFGTILETNGNRFDNRIRLRGEYVAGNAEAFIQELVTTTDETGFTDTYWNLIMRNVRYKTSVLKMEADWRISASEGKWSSGLFAKTERVTKEYILPHSKMEYTRLQGGVEGSTRFLKSFSAEGRISWVQGIQQGLELNQNLDKEKKTIIRDNVVLHDYDIFGLNAMNFDASIRFDFKAFGYKAFTKASTSWFFTMPAGKRRGLSGITLGILL